MHLHLNRLLLASELFKVDVTEAIPSLLEQEVTKLIRSYSYLDWY